MIRNAFPADIEPITDIYNEAIREGGYSGYLEPLPIENRRAWYREHQGRYGIFVKTVGGMVIGYVALSPYRGGRTAFSETCEISYYVASQHRGQGFGKELIGYAIERAGRMSFHLMVAMVLQSNQRSIDLLKAFDFAISGKLPDAARIKGAYIDHIYLSRRLAL